MFLCGIDRQMSCMLTSFGVLAVNPRRGAIALGRHQEANILISLLTKPLSAKGERKLTWRLINSASLTQWALRLGQNGRGRGEGRYKPRPWPSGCQRRTSMCTEWDTSWGSPTRSHPKDLWWTSSDLSDHQINYHTDVPSLTSAVSARPAGRLTIIIVLTIC